jgi:hypothetical protein
MKYDENLEVKIFPSVPLDVIESALIDEILYRINTSRCKTLDNIAWVPIKSTEFVLDNSRLRMFSVDQIRKSVTSLYIKGLLVRRTSGLKATVDYSPNVLNLMILSMMGAEQMSRCLESIRGSGWEGHYCKADVIKEMSLVSPVMSSPFMPSTATPMTQHSLSELVSMIYAFDIRKLDEKCFDGHLLLPDRSNSPLHTSTMLMNDIGVMDNVRMAGHGDIFSMCHGVLGAGRIPVAGIMSVCITIDVKPEPGPKLELRQEEPKAEDRFTDYVSYCKYMRVSDTMKKPTEEWTCRDFVIYYYCGISKLKEKDYTVPNFARDCVCMQKVMKRYDNERLRKVIHCMITRNTEIGNEKRIKDFSSLTMSTLSVDWIMEKVCEFMDSMSTGNREAAAAKESRTVEKSIAAQEDTGLLSPERKKRLEELRLKFNKREN